MRTEIVSAIRPKVACGPMSDAANVYELREQPAPPELVLSVVLAAYNEEGHVLEELDRIERSLTDAGVAHEIIVVDDASTDSTPEKVTAWARPRLIRLERNRGSGAARKIGTRAAHGK